MMTHFGLFSLPGGNLIASYPSWEDGVAAGEEILRDEPEAAGFFVLCGFDAEGMCQEAYDFEMYDFETPPDIPEPAVPHVFVRKPF